MNQFKGLFKVSILYKYHIFRKEYSITEFAHEFVSILYKYHIFHEEVDTDSPMVTLVSILYKYHIFPLEP